VYAIFEDSGTQVKVQVGDEVELDARAIEGDSKTISFDKVLVIGTDGAPGKIGLPYLKGATVTADVLGPVLGDKLRIGKYKRRKGYRRQAGHRQEFLHVKITGING
jgi:large subunit ribosomal protein L21